MFTALYYILKIIASIASPFCVLAVIFYLYKGIKRFFTGNPLSFSNWIFDIKHGLENFANFLLGGSLLPVLIISLISVLVTNATAHQLIGIHNLELKPDGTYCFYVEAQRNGHDPYVLPAQIQVYTESFDTGEGTSQKRTDYYIEKVFFSNGGYLDTDDSERDHIGKTSYFYDDNGDEWSLTLLNQHAYTPYVKETNNATWFNITLLMIQVASFTLSLYAWCKKETEVIQ